MTTATRHRWTDADRTLMAHMIEHRYTSHQIADAIGTTWTVVNVYRRRLGLTRHRSTCIVCHKAVQSKDRGRAREMCSTQCGLLLQRAYAMNDRVDGRDITHCLNCGGLLIPPWTLKRKWCSRVCGQAGWYVSVSSNPRKYEFAKARTHLAQQRRQVFDQLTSQEEDWLYTLRVDGHAPPYWCTKLRKKLMLDSTKALIRYARAIEAWS